MTNHRLLSHKNHNPQCDIIESRIDKDSHITYGIYVNGPKTGDEFFEYYRGSNYNVGSNLPSYSLHKAGEDNVPKAHKNRWNAARKYYQDLMAEITALEAQELIS
jgi:hypothetical protein